MKTTYIFRKIFLVYVLCLLWPPNYCDGKQEDVDHPIIETVTSGAGSRIGNVPTKQEMESHSENLDISQNIPVQSNVEYVNSEHKESVAKPDNLKLNVPQQTLNLGKISPQIAGNLLSSKSSGKSESLKRKIGPQIPKNLKSDKPGEAKQPPSPLKVDSTTVLHSIDPTSESTVSREQSVPKEATTIDLGGVQKSAQPPFRTPPILASENSVVEETLHPQPHYDGMPSFDEWKRMMLAEHEKGDQKLPPPVTIAKKISSQKRRRNYSSYECGAKIVASNAEAEGTSRLLNELVDEYLLNPCKAKIWFVIELCETVQATQIELANFELFSSAPKDFAVYASDNFPTRDWHLLGAFTATEQRVLQSFDLKQEGFGKFIKVELLSHYGREHYCPLSIVRIFGTSMVDEYEEMETLASHTVVSDDDLDRLDLSLEDEKSTNIFGSATDAVMSIVKKAAQALGQQPLEVDGKSNETASDPQNSSRPNLCKPAENVSDNCVEDLQQAQESFPPLHNFSLLPTSSHHALFRLLHRCDQCVSPRIRYYSSAQPHCRFFQAAFGPVAFQSLCDWFKEHPLVFPYESSANRNEAPQQDRASATHPPKSPPPQIINIIPDNDTSVKLNILKENVSLSDVSNEIHFINATKTLADENNAIEASFEVSLEPSIQILTVSPSAHTEKIDNKELVDAGTRSATVSISRESLENVDKVSAPSKSPFLISQQSDMPLDMGITDSLTVDVEFQPPESTAFPDISSESYEEQLKEFMSEAVPIADDLQSPELASATGIPFKSVEEKSSDTRSDILEKLEPVAAIPGISTPGQKESVFMRMSNRIKSLELNMSLSSQYLQELSQRYRRQMDEMQRAFNRTIGTLNGTAKKAAERDIKQQEILNTLQLQVSNLTETVEVLVNERSSMFQQMIETHLCLMVVEAIIMITVMSLCVRRISSSSAGQTPPHPMQREEEEPIIIMPPPPSRLAKRRSSADSCTPPIARKVKRRSASEEALDSGEEPLIIETLPAYPEPILKAKKKNRKRSKVQRSISTPSVPGLRTVNVSTVKRVSYSDDSALSKKSKSKQQLHEKNYPCENCNDLVCSVSHTSEGKVNGTPFQNLTNESNNVSRKPSHHQAQKVSKGRERFGFKKILKFQKRDSI